ncbi:MAG TPA: hypothetical protein VKI17_04590 [Gemmataceae bacterium]|nr:hypothetical protein [Gemmataceae bacterium]
MPGYAECFCHLWDDSPAPLLFARHTTSADAVRHAGVAGLQQIAAQAGLRCRGETFHKILAWAKQAPPDAGHPLDRRRILTSLDDDRLAKTGQILELERDLAHLVVHTPYVLLLAIPGINIVTIADLAGELGPIALYRRGVANPGGIKADDLPGVDLLPACGGFTVEARSLRPGADRYADDPRLWSTLV